MHRELDTLIWTIVAVVAMFIMGCVAVGDFRIYWASFADSFLAVVVLLAGTWFYANYRFDPRLASALGSTAQITAFVAVGAPLSYVAASLALPLQDRVFDSADHALGFDWRELLAWMNTHAGLHSVFGLAYSSILPQAVVVVIALAFSGRLIWLRVFTLAFFFAALVTIVIAAFVPAQGVWGYYGLTASDHPQILPVTRELHLAIFHGLRDGTFRQLVADGAQGIITFPSLHAALALILAAGLWPVPVLRWIGVAVNILMLISVPVDGGHYFIDVFAGLVIAAGSLVLAKRLGARASMASAPGVSILGAPGLASK
jgi:membrane-associated phospholipid phosphatase